VIRRYIAAPFEGTLERSLVEPGDLVAAEQVLARMDDRDVRFELAGLEAEFQRAAKQRDAHLAAHDYGAAALSKFEMERLDVKRRMFEHRQERLDVKSPIDGIVVSGDLKRAEGIRLTTGQRLFEVAPLDAMIVEIAVEESDIAYVQAGQTVTVVPDAFPDRRLTAVIERVHPRSEVRDGAHVFIAEVRVQNADGLLQPGMRGRAHVSSGQCALGWRLLHKPWEQLRLRWGW
jgi:multidrug resistance efflux pump